jgi:hypothetical protein
LQLAHPACRLDVSRAHIAKILPIVDVDAHLRRRPTSGRLACPRKAGGGGTSCRIPPAGSIVPRARVHRSAGHGRSDVWWNYEGTMKRLSATSRRRASSQGSRAHGHDIRRDPPGCYRVPDRPSTGRQRAQAQLCFNYPLRRPDLPLGQGQRAAEPCVCIQRLDGREWCGARASLPRASCPCGTPGGRRDPSQCRAVCAVAFTETGVPGLRASHRLLGTRSSPRKGRRPSSVSTSAPARTLQTPDVSDAVPVADLLEQCRQPRRFLFCVLVRYRTSFTPRQIGWIPYTPERRRRVDHPPVGRRSGTALNRRRRTLPQVQLLLQGPDRREDARADRRG